MAATNIATISARATETGVKSSTSDLSLGSIVLLKKQRKLSETGTSRIFAGLHEEPTTPESEHLYALEIIVPSLGKGISTLRLPEAASTELFKRRIL